MERNQERNGTQSCNLCPVRHNCMANLPRQSQWSKPPNTFDGCITQQGKLEDLQFDFLPPSVLCRPQPPHTGGVCPPPQFVPNVRRVIFVFQGTNNSFNTSPLQQWLNLAAATLPPLQGQPAPLSATPPPYRHGPTRSRTDTGHCMCPNITDQR